MSHEIRDAAANYGALTTIQRAQLASLGLGASELRRIQRMIQRYGTTDENGRWNANLERWGATDEGVRASRDFRIAVARDMNRSVVTPGLGDTPILMSTWWGRLLLQFQSHSFAFMNSFIQPMVQRGASLGDIRAAGAMLMLAFSSFMVVAAKDLSRGQDPTERYRDPEMGVKTAHELIDRSGMLAHFAPWIATGLNVTGIGQGASRYRRADGITPMMGASMGLANDFTNFLGAAYRGASGEEEGWTVAKKAARLAPFYSLGRMLYSLGDYAAGGT